MMIYTRLLGGKEQDPFLKGLLIPMERQNSTLFQPPTIVWKEFLNDDEISQKSNFSYLFTYRYVLSIIGYTTAIRNI